MGSGALPLMLAADFGGRAGGWTPAGFLLLVALFWAVRSVPPAEPLRPALRSRRPHRSHAGRSRGGAAVTGGGYDYVPVLSAFLLALVVQQLATAVLVRMGVPSLAPDASLAGFSLAALPVLAALAIADDTRGERSPAAPSCSSSSRPLASAGHSPGKLRTGTPWRSGVRELLPLGMAAALAGLAFTGVSLRQRQHLPGPDGALPRGNGAAPRCTAAAVELLVDGPGDRHRPGPDGFPAAAAGSRSVAGWRRGAHGRFAGGAGAGTAAGLPPAGRGPGQGSRRCGRRRRRGAGAAGRRPGRPHGVRPSGPRRPEAGS